MKTVKIKDKTMMLKYYNFYSTLTYFCQRKAFLAVINIVKNVKEKEGLRIRHKL